MHDSTTALMGLGGFILLGALFFGVWRLRKWWESLPQAKEAKEGKRPQSGSLDLRERERKQAYEKAVADGVILPSGRIRCIVGTNGSQCPNPAEHGHLAYSRGAGLFAWFRERLGAPVRWSVTTPNPEDLAYCPSHVHLAESEMILNLHNEEAERIRGVRDAEVRLGDFERRKLRLRLTELHERQLRQKDKTAPASASNVTPIRKAGGT